MIRRLILIAAAAALVTAAFVLRQAERTQAPDESARRQTTASEGASLPRLVDLGADKCVPCKQMAPLLQELSEEYSDRFIVEFIDVWKDPAAAEPYGIRMIPTQIFFDATGIERFRHEGFLPKEAILAKWRELGVPLPRLTPTGAM